MSGVVESLARRYEAIKPHLTERQRRVWLGSEARELGSGGVALVADAVRVSRDTVRRGRTELDDLTPLPVGRSRGRGGGRKRAEDHDPELAAALDKLVDPDSRGDPMTPLRWTSKSLRSLADELRAQGHQLSPTLVQRLLHEAGYSLRSNSKTLEGSQHPDRDAQLRHIHDTVAACLAADSGGSNGSRRRTWKTELAALAAEHQRVSPAAGHQQMEQDRGAPRGVTISGGGVRPLLLRCRSGVGKAEGSLVAETRARVGA